MARRKNAWPPDQDVTVVCAACGLVRSVSRGQARRQKKEGRPTLCGSCAAKARATARREALIAERGENWRSVRRYVRVEVPCRICGKPKSIIRHHLKYDGGLCRICHARRISGIAQGNAGRRRWYVEARRSVARGAPDPARKHPLPDPARQLSASAVAAIAAYDGPVTRCPPADVREQTCIAVRFPEGMGFEYGVPVPVVFDPWVDEQDADWTWEE